MKHKIKEGDIVTIFDLTRFQLVDSTVTLVKEAQDLYGYVTQGQYHTFSLPFGTYAGGEEIVVHDEEILAVNGDFFLTKKELAAILTTKIKSNDTKVSMQFLSKMLGVLNAS